MSPLQLQQVSVLLLGIVVAIISSPPPPPLFCYQDTSVAAVSLAMLWPSSDVRCSLRNVKSSSSSEGIACGGFTVLLFVAFVRVEPPSPPAQRCDQNLQRRRVIVLLLLFVDRELP